MRVHAMSGIGQFSQISQQQRFCLSVAVGRARKRVTDLMIDCQNISTARPSPLPQHHNHWILPPKDCSTLIGSIVLVCESSGH